MPRTAHATQTPAMPGMLLLNTSPRRHGNCADAAVLVQEALAARGGAAQLLHLADCDIKRCRGCLECQRGKRCGIRDEFGKPWSVVKQAATVVLFVPVYWCAPPGLMKDFMDRTVCDYAAGDGGVMHGKQVHLVSVAQSAGFGPHEQIIGTWVRWLGGPKLTTRLRLIAFHRGELRANAAAVRKLQRLAGTL